MATAGIENNHSEERPAVWFVYILQCADGSYYTGITTDLERRCKQHNAGTASRYTRSRLPVCIVYSEIQSTRSLALKREAAIKAISRQKKKLLIKTAGPRSQPPELHIDDRQA